MWRDPGWEGSAVIREREGRREPGPVPRGPGLMCVSQGSTAGPVPGSGGAGEGRGATRGTSESWHEQLGKRGRPV